MMYSAQGTDRSRSGEFLLVWNPNTGQHCPGIERLFFPSPPAPSQNALILNVASVGTERALPVPL
jgi:hypothetical protein